MSARGDGTSPLNDGEPPTEDPPPLLGSWTALYAVVLGTLAALIALFAVLTRLLS